jgi:hypothetical protein
MFVLHGIKLPNDARVCMITNQRWSISCCIVASAVHVGVWTGSRAEEGCRRVRAGGITYHIHCIRAERPAGEICKSNDHDIFAKDHDASACALLLTSTVELTLYHYYSYEVVTTSLAICLALACRRYCSACHHELVLDNDLIICVVTLRVVREVASRYSGGDHEVRYTEFMTVFRHADCHGTVAGSVRGHRAACKSKARVYNSG